MKLPSVLAGALASVFVTAFLSGTASADMRIVNDPGGEVSSYVLKFNKVRATGQRVVIDGPCLSACTLLTGIVPRHQVCVTKRAVLGFHAASYYDDVSRSLVPTRAGTPLLDRSPWRADAAPHDHARPRSRSALFQVLVKPLSPAKLPADSKIRRGDQVGTVAAVNTIRRWVVVGDPPPDPPIKRRHSSNFGPRTAASFENLNPAPNRHF
jgi:hypothetical protein